ncbi:hypothetical protein BCR37DRAFT_378155 [Protomyces lactucae-debilis]|uniref:RRM domain-containing protein n=1 Tax=Protomyces lactucae-debilis TaxID=2754530 RepID=A0A1Y2FMD0_PROLT|nr:uncharacterized protein BCR37DRAFT_378155 [Protomyces lactucae-debilis]ORY85098.1 hypothetical protein BCR37DRAFT_378155 [Protomyces lactucae-debilis]
MNAINTDIFVGGLEAYISEESLHRCAARYGSVNRIRLLARGCALITFDTVDGRDSALRGMMGAVLSGKRIRVSPSRQPRLPPFGPRYSETRSTRTGTVDHTRDQDRFANTYLHDHTPDNPVRARAASTKGTVALYMSQEKLTLGDEGSSPDINGLTPPASAAGNISQQYMDDGILPVTREQLALLSLGDLDDLAELVALEVRNRHNAMLSGQDNGNGKRRRMLMDG